MLPHHPANPFGLPVAPRPRREIELDGGWLGLGRRETHRRFERTAEFDGHRKTPPRESFLAFTPQVFTPQVFQSKRRRATFERTRLMRPVVPAGLYTTIACSGRLRKGASRGRAIRANSAHRFQSALRKVRLNRQGPVTGWSPSLRASTPW